MAGDIYRYKLILFGNERVGKTSIVDRFVNNKFEDDYISTLGYNVFEKRLTISECIVSLMVYDIGGQEKFTSLRRQYANGAHAAFLVYDITDLDSFNDIRRWKADLSSSAGEIPYVIIGNKKDLESQRQVMTQEAERASLELKAATFIETSAKTGEGIEAAFNQLASSVLKS